jgi:hypothetical protein
LEEKPESKVNATIEAIKSTSATIKTAATDASRTAYDASKKAVKVAGEEIVGDLNGDGKVDAEDAKIALENAKRVAVKSAKEVRKQGRIVLDSELFKDILPYAAIGALIAIPIPIAGPLIGAALGAGLGLYKNATKRK